MTLPYDPFPFLTQLLTTIGPAIQQFVKLHEAEETQHVTLMRMKHFKHYCKKSKLKGKPADILIAVKLFFKDYTPELQIELAQLMDDELDN